MSNDCHCIDGNAVCRTCWHADDHELGQTRDPADQDDIDTSRRLDERGNDQ